MNISTTHRVILLATASLLASCGGTSTLLAVDPDQACQALAARLKLEGSVVDSATYVPAGVVPPGLKAAVPQAFCRVKVTSRLTADSDIKSEIWMPAASRWNGRFLATGGGGNSGAIIYSRLVDGMFSPGWVGLPGMRDRAQFVPKENLPRHLS